jgi:two-component system sensor histidine kinase and response regulator WspE
MTQINGQDLSSFSMLDLFRSEVEVHAVTLNDGLLALESGSVSAENIESLMRAAHSIKGGARIVDLDMVVKLAHTMEDCFVELQKGTLPLKNGLESHHIDVLLRGVDMITQISEAAGEGIEDWLAARRKETDELLADISAVLAGTYASPQTEEQEKGGSTQETGGRTQETEDSTQETGEKKPDAEKREQQAGDAEDEDADDSEAEPDNVTPKKKRQQKPDTCTAQGTSDNRQASAESPSSDRMIRITATKIERLMGLAGEVVVSSRWLPPFSKSLLKLKKDHIRLAAILEKLQETLDQEKSDLHHKNRKLQNSAKRSSRRGSCDLQPATKIRSRADLRKMVAQAREKLKDCNQYLADRLNRVEMFTSASENLSDRLYHEVIRVRMRPFSDGVRGFPRIVRDLSRELRKKVRLKIVGESTEVDRDILEKLDAPLNHLIRNALDHGIESPKERAAAGKPETATLTLEAAHRSGILMITVSDDGRGADPDQLRRKILEKGLASAEMIDRLTEPELMDFLFLPGFSTLDQVSEISGRGVGLDVVHNMVHEVGGVVRAVSKLGKGLTFQMELPLTLSVIRTFLVEITREPYAFPLARIERCLMIDRRNIETVEDREYFRLDSKNISLVDIHDVLELEKPPAQKDRQLRVVVISDRMHSYGLVVDQFLGECDLVVRPLDPRLGKVRDISAAAVMLDGSPVMIFDVEDLVRSVDSLLGGKQRIRKIGHAGNTDEKTAKHILVVDDSITVREMERKLLESKGYQVDVAVDGTDAWNLLRIAPYDMVVSDIDMPRMNGIELITHIKQNENLKSLPIMIVSYKNKEEDRLRGLEAGANYYLTKSSFQDNSFIEAVADLIGEP